MTRKPTIGPGPNAPRSLAVAALLAALTATVALVTGASEAPAVEYLNARAGVEYVGDEACRQCHLGQYESFKKTAMGRSMARPNLRDSLGLFSKPVTLRGEKDGHVYSVYVENGKVYHRETALDAGGKPVFTETHEVAYSVGSGGRGRSYFVARGDFLFLSPLSFYTSIRRWDLSPGYESGLYRGFTRPVGELCVSCHSGLPQPVRGTANQYRQPAFASLTIGCERCHGPGALHVAGRSAAPPARGSLDRTIVNPRKLTARLRDDVCYQCHLAGDVRVQRPGKNALDFRPGTLLDDVVAVFSVPTSFKAGGFEALSQAEQIQMSRCQQPDGTALNCITCHDPHGQPVGAKAADYFRGKCLKCHAPESSGFISAHRSLPSPSTNCIACHMPKASVTNIAHVAYTDHRIPKNPADTARPSTRFVPDPETNLVWLTGPHDGRKLDLRTLALAFAQLASNYPGYGARGFPLLERAAREMPNDAEVQTTYGQVMLIARLSPDYRAKAKRAFQQAVSAGSKSATLRRRLAQLLLEDGDSSGIGLLREAIQLEPYEAATYLQLARAYAATGARGEAIKVVGQALNFDPGNADARKLLRELTSSP